MLSIKKDDQVVIIAGKDKGKTGRVLQTIPADKRVIVEHINVIKKAQRKTQKNPQGGYADIEMPIHISNVMLIDKKSNKGTRIGASILKDGTKERISKRSREVI